MNPHPPYQAVAFDTLMALPKASKLGIFAAVLAFTMLGGSWWLQHRSHPGPSGVDNPLPYRYTATGQVTGLTSLGNAGCRVQIRLHQWVSMSAGFTLAEMPQRGQVYSVLANTEQCTALEVALASLGNPNDLKNPRHIYYQVERRSGAWHMTQNPTAPLGCGGL